MMLNCHAIRSVLLGEECTDGHILEVRDGEKSSTLPTRDHRIGCSSPFLRLSRAEALSPTSPHEDCAFRIEREAARWLAWLALALCLSGWRTACGQTPSPLQEWQYPGGIMLEKLFEPQEPKWRRIVGIASSVEPVYDGAHAYRIEGGPVINIRYRDIAFASIGEGVGVNLVRAKHFRAGVAVGYDVGRRTSSDYRDLHGLDDINPAAAPKVFAEWAISIHFPLILRADIRRIIRGDDGYIGDIDAYMPLPGSSRRFVMFAGPTYTFADQRHMQKMFGITPAQALSSGYPVFTAHGGSAAKGVGFSATLFINHDWLLNVDAAENRLLGSASESPITQRRRQRTLALATAYQW
jgi:outer membrane scaffolding protein for murein synthesis (MipA/OmpV family)